jgi:hypothetical protein
MPKTLHLSKEFFINAPEQTARQYILQLPECISNIKFVEENRVRQSMRFIYERAEETNVESNLIEVSLLPLNVHQTRITLHGTYDGQNAVKKEFKITNALSNFESAILAVVKGTPDEYQPQHVKTKAPQSIRYLLGLVGLGCAMYLLKNLFV